MAKWTIPDMLTRSQADAMVAAALTEAVDLVWRRSGPTLSKQVRALITEDAQTALNRAIKDAVAEATKLTVPIAALTKMLADAEAKGMRKAVVICETHGVLGGPVPNPYAEWKTHADNLAATILAAAEAIQKGGET